MIHSRYLGFLIIICAVSVALGLPPGGGGGGSSSQKTHRGFEGKVTDEDGKPLNGVQITLFNVDADYVEEVRNTSQSDEKKSLSTTTRTKGRYKFVAIRPGIYRIRYELPGYQILERLIEFKRGSKDAVMNIKLQELTTVASPAGQQG